MKQYKYFVLAALTGMYCFSVIDRQILVILQESIKKDLHLSDGQLGLLSGFTFGIFYTLLGIPIARMADRFNRKNIISVSLLLWSLMTAVSGFAKNFVQLFFARIGVGIGEAGGNPSAYSILSDYFPKAKRASAFATYNGGAFVGILLGYFFGGILNQKYGWRMTFLFLGIPGVLYALFLFLFVKEPMKGILDNREGNVEQHLPFKESVQSIFKSKSYIYLCLAFGATLFSFYGTNNWMPSLLSRLHGMKSNEIGTSLSLIVGGSGIVGTLIGGKLIDKYSLVNVKYFLWLPAIGNLISIPFSLVVILSSNKLLVLTFFIVPSFLNCMFLGTAFALIYRLVGNNVKALASSFFLLIANILGVTLAPFVIGTISDLLTQSMGIYSIRWALLFTIFISMISVLLFLKSSRYLTAELKP